MEKMLQDRVAIILNFSLHLYLKAPLEPNHRLEG